jgi:hypothetical protein
MYSCSKCSYASKYKANLERHTPKCKGEKGPLIYSCPVCSAYTTNNKAHLERHQASDLCKTKAEDKEQTNVTLEQRVLELEQENKQLRKDVNLLLKWFENRPQTKEEKNQEEEKYKRNIKRELTVNNISFDPLETLAGLRHLRQTLIYDKRNQQL